MLPTSGGGGNKAKLSIASLFFKKYFSGLVVTSLPGGTAANTENEIRPKAITKSCFFI